VDAERLARKNHIYHAGDRTKKGDEVAPGFPFAPADLKFRGDRRQTFLDWLTAPENPLFARVAVNRIWQWHFGEGLVPTPNDFGNTGQPPSNPALLDWLASEFVANKFSMKAMHRLIVTSEAYQRGANREAANLKNDPANKYLWQYPSRRLDAETIRDGMLHAAGTLDTSIGGRSFRAGDILERRVMSAARTGHYDTRANRRGIYMGRGTDASMNMMPAYLTLFDAEDGHVPCARRERTVTAPQVLWTMNGELAQEAAAGIARRLEGATAREKADHAFQLVLGRSPSAAERDQALSYAARGTRQDWEGLAWTLLNLTEFVFLP
jgi:hypothetical protein